MGLDVTAYRQIKLVPGAETDTDGCPLDENLWSPGTAMEWSESEWPGRAKGIPDAKACYSYEDCDSSIGYSYSTHTWFRDHLARLAGFLSAESIWDDPQPGPFVELIHFADNEGVIGPVVADKLAKDFADYRAKMQAKYDSSDRFRKLYCQWQAACEMAADSGALDFH